MGYYIEVPQKTRKAAYLQKYFNAADAYDHVNDSPPSFDHTPPGSVLICVVENGPFDAAGIIYDLKEYEAFVYPDNRPRTWLYMTKDQVIELCPRAEERL